MISEVASRRCTSVGFLVVPALIGTLLFGSARGSDAIDLEVVSSRPDLVSGGDVLVRLTPTIRPGWRVRLNGHDVTQDFRPAQTLGGVLALLNGLEMGDNSLEVATTKHTRKRLVIVNHPIEGPIFSGPHQKPFICQTEANGLGPATDADCRAATIIQYYYKPLHAEVDQSEAWVKATQVLMNEIAGSIPSGYKFYDPNRPPVDVAQTVTAEGNKVPYIVRREIGTINRAIYDIRFLHQPGHPLPTPWSDRTPGWNGRLVYEFGGGCAAGYRQGLLEAPSSDEVLLARGFAVATSTFNIFGNNCNDQVSAETISMVKEHFVKTRGKPVHTIGWGGSGGAMQLYLTAQNHPGFLDGIITSVSFPDVLTYLHWISDCPLLLRATRDTAHGWTDEQKTAVTGLASWRVCSIFEGGVHIAARNCSAAIPQEEIYDPATNPKGVRCDIYDNEINVFGKDPNTGFARSTLDNIGVEYGLVAFNAGRISAEQFVELNELAGGYTAEGTLAGHRTEADTEAVRQAYSNGVVLWGGGGLRETPVIDWRWYSDDLADNHDSVRSFVVRDRLQSANGTAANQVILIDPRASSYLMALSWLRDSSLEDSVFTQRERDLFEWMDHWLDNISADNSIGSLAEKVARDKPSDLSDTCWTAEGEKITGNVYGATGKCGQIYPRHGDPRIAAGGPLTDDVLKCALKPLNASNYTHPLTTDQVAQLKAVFPTGVCDYSHPGVGEEGKAITKRRVSRE